MKANPHFEQILRLGNAILEWSSLGESMLSAALRSDAEGSNERMKNDQTERKKTKKMG
jgi:hypothetical protein